MSTDSANKWLTPSRAPPPLPLPEEFDALCGLVDLDSWQASDALESYVQSPPNSIPLSRYDHNFASDTDNSGDFSGNDRASPDEGSWDVGNWPRRLLHVPSMTSLEWKPGNTYGGHVAPRYNAVSYTWGRYDLDIPGGKKKKAFRNIKAIGISGVDWTIPRICPEHFNVDQFQDLIKQACEPANVVDEKTEFLWLDVACIDQNNGPSKMAEIGRQAAIFRGAQNVFVWLTKLSANRFPLLMRNLLQSSDEAVAYAQDKRERSKKQNALMAWLALARTSLDGIFIDPWFTSLWTLQEAFLCRKAYLLPLEAVLVSVSANSNGDAISYTTLDAFCNICEKLREVYEGEIHIVRGEWRANKADADLCKQEKYLDDVWTMMHQRGLLALASQNPVALYSIAQYRSTRNDQDRVYGIEQVFGFRLGATAPKYTGSKQKVFNRFVLEDQLGAAMLGKHPVASQMHKFNEPVEEGRGWRISGSSGFPQLDIKSSIWDLELKFNCQFSTTKIKSQRWGCFSGRVCDFSRLSKAWETFHNRCLSRQALRTKSPQQVILDTLIGDGEGPYKAELLANDEEAPIWTAVWTNRPDVPRNGQQHRLCQELIELMRLRSAKEVLIVLLVGSFRDGRHVDGSVNESDNYHVGLILSHTEIGTRQYWKRLSFCIWQYEYCDAAPHETEFLQSSLLLAEDGLESWKDLSGLFG